ncbi:hypothetical protein HRW22_32420, partial [Streptomyces lunaelactis]|nr:hypothetical protein [Streptomyces lunaelactis]
MVTPVDLTSMSPDELMRVRITEAELRNLTPQQLSELKTRLEASRLAVNRLDELTREVPRVRQAIRGAAREIRHLRQLRLDDPQRVQGWSQARQAMQDALNRRTAVQAELRNLRPLAQNARANLGTLQRVARPEAAPSRWAQAADWATRNSRTFSEWVRRRPPPKPPGDDPGGQAPGLLRQAFNGVKSGGRAVWNGVTNAARSARDLLKNPSQWGPALRSGWQSLSNAGKNALQSGWRVIMAGIGFALGWGRAALTAIGGFLSGLSMPAILATLGIAALLAGGGYALSNTGGTPDTAGNQPPANQQQQPGGQEPQGGVEPPPPGGGPA